MPTVHVPAFTAHTIHDIAHTYIDVAPVQADHIVTTRNGAPRTCTVRVSADAVIRLVRRRGSKAFAATFPVRDSYRTAGGENWAVVDSLYACGCRSGI